MVDFLKFSENFLNYAGGLLDFSTLFVYAV